MSKKKEEKNIPVIPYKKWLFSLVALAVILVVFLAFRGDNSSPSVDNNSVIKESSLDIKELFNCEGKNTFSSDCWKKIQFVDKQVVYTLSPGGSIDITFAFMNRDDAKASFSYTLASLTSADLQKDGCPALSMADSYIAVSGSDSGILLDAQEVTSRKVSVKAPTINPPSSGCPYRYVLDVKKDGKFYEKTYFDIMIK